MNRNRRAIELLKKLEHLDRRWIFLIMAAAIITPLLVPIGFRIVTTKPVEDFYRAIEELPEGSVVLVSDDWDPGSKAELLPVARVIHEHLFRRRIRTVAMSLWVPGVPIIEQTVREAAATQGAEYGRDYVFLGGKPGQEAVMVSMGESIPQTFPTDHYQNSLPSLPLMATGGKDGRPITNYEDFALVISVSAGYPGTKEWVQQVQNRFRVAMVSAASGVSTPEYYPYYESRQLLGLVGGLKAIAEYESLSGTPGFATKAMDAQSIGHLTLVILILVGNALYLGARALGDRR